MKSLNIKIPIKVAQAMDNNAELNPSYITSFIVTHLNYGKTAQEHEMTGLTYNYTFKVPSDLHKAVKLKSIELNLPMNEFIGRLLDYYYKG